MAWPPRTGEPLPRADEASGILEKLRDYVLDPEHDKNQGKAHGFAVRLGIGSSSIDHLVGEIEAGVVQSRISSVRPRPFGLNCVVEFEVSGTGRYSDRKSNIRTIWQFRAPGDRPRLITVYPR